jgi:cytochrome P450
MDAEIFDARVPGHVNPEQVFEFDIYEDERLRADLHGGFKSLHGEAPDMFYTPCNGGHWMAARYDLIASIMYDSEHFSNTEMDVPKSASKYVMIPLNIDPSDHAPYRPALMRYFSPKAVGAHEDRTQGWAERLIDSVASKRRDFG